MKILAVSHYFPPHIGGIEIITENQVKYLAKRGNDVRVLTSAIDHKRGSTPHTDNYVVYRVPAWNILEKVRGIPFPIYSPRIIFTAHKLVREVEVVHVHDVYYFSTWVAVFWAVVYRKPLVISQHVSLVEHNNRLIMKAQMLIYKTVGKLLYKVADNVIVYNVNDKMFLTTLGVKQSKMYLIPNSIDTDYFTPTANKEKRKLKIKYHLPVSKPIVLYVGRLVPKKGYKIVLHAKSEDYITLIVGGGNVSEAEKAEKDVIFYGPASQNKLRDLYRLSDVFVFPTIGEIFTLVMLEAMSCGLPVITTDDDGYRLYNLRRGLIGFIKRDSNALKKKIIEIVFNEKLKKDMNRYSRSLALEKFSYEQNYEQELEIFKSLTKKS